MVIEDLAEILARADLTSPHPLGTDRIATLQPVDDIQVMDVLLDDVIAAQPVEVVPVAHLVFHLRLSFGAGVNPHAGAVPIDASGHNVADRAVLQAFDRFDVRGLVMALQTDANGQIFLTRGLAAVSTARTPGPSTATGFSMKTCLPASTAAAKCTGRKPGGVARMTRSTPASMTFL